MSIDTEHQNKTHSPTTSCASGSKGKASKEVDLSAYENLSHFDPLERFPSPPGVGCSHVPQTKGESDATPMPTPHVATPDLYTPLDPPLMTFTYPPLPPLSNDPTWYAQMVADVHRHRAHVITELDLAQTEAIAALADVTLAEVELAAEMDRMQKFLDRIASVAGKTFVRKMIMSVHGSMGDRIMVSDDESEQDLGDADDENSSGDEEEHELHQQDAEYESSSPNAGESEEDQQDAEDEEYSRSGDHDSRVFVREGSPANGSPSSPVWPLGHADYREDEYSSGADDAKSREWSESSPANGRQKRQLEDEEEEEDSSDDPPRKKFKGEIVAEPTPASTQHSEGGGREIEVAVPTSQCVWAPEDEIDSELDSDEEYEVESLTLEVEPVLPDPSVRHLRDIGRDPFRVRQNSWGEPQLYIPNRR
ncbi:hypothetical protein EDB19DRAFT_1906137 [Suillus lakei]|nr:hypothetical protein EDB19DRAFT_1906137 [Suillus lakei]